MLKKIGKFFTGMRLKRKFNLVITVLVVIPMVFLGWYIFHEMTENTIVNSETYMLDTMEKERTSVDHEIETLQMTTQYILEDHTIHDLLNLSMEGEKPDAEALMDIYDENIRHVEQLLYSNPSLYSLRVYSADDNVTEMMPVLYRHNRMLKQSWANTENPSGYYFDYADHIFENRDVQDAGHLIGLITPVEDGDMGITGYIEAAIGIPYLFPEMYSPEKGEEGFLVLSDGSTVHRRDADDLMKEAALSSAGIDCRQKEITVSEVQKDKSRYIVSSLYIEPMNAHYVRVLDLSERFARLNRQKGLMMIIFAAMVVILMTVTDTLVDWLLRDFYSIFQTVSTVQQGNLNVRVPALKEADAAVLGTEINAMLDRIDALMKENLEKGLLEKNAQIRALENQINAHFMYNVLESINMMAEINGEYEISDAVVELGNMMRYSLRWTDGLVTIQEEMEYVRNYLALMNIRLNDQVQLETDISEKLMKNVIPKMTLQPLVENAVVHGLAGRDAASIIEIRAEVKGDDTLVHVIDHGCGMAEQEVKDLQEKMEQKPEASQKHGYALRNLKERIRILCGEKYGLSVSSQPGKGTEVTVILPHMERMENSKI